VQQKRSSAAFRYRVQKECGPIIFLALYRHCVASFPPSVSIIDEPGIYHPSPPAVLVFTRVSVGYFRRRVFAAADELAGDLVAAWRF
jgi:hypothetical protein